jgi:hypothetical protein
LASTGGWRPTGSGLEMAGVGGARRRWPYRTRRGREVGADAWGPGTVPGSGVNGSKGFKPVK